MKIVCCDVCSVMTLMLPAFGAGVLLTLFLPPTALVGACAATSVAFGVVCILPKRKEKCFENSCGTRPKGC